MSVMAFSPDWISPPGDTIRDALAARRLTDRDFAAGMEMSLNAVDDLLTGNLVIEPSIAERLSALLGSTVNFWMKRESIYRMRLKEREQKASADARIAFLKELPIRDMKAFGWLNGFAGRADEDAALSFFGPGTEDWLSNGVGLARAVAFRTSEAYETNPAAVAAWLRHGVVQASKIDCAPWKPEALTAALPEIRKLTRVKDPLVFCPALVEICKQAGVATIFSRTPKGCRASGATHFASADKAIIQLSFRYRSDDHFWFTFFHEAGHLLLHAGSPLFVEGKDYVDTIEEAEANDFASKMLIPSGREPEMAALPKKFSAIMRFAKRIGVSSGVVVGQMQNRGLLRHDQMNFLKVRYDWDQMAAITL